MRHTHLFLVALLCGCLSKAPQSAHFRFFAPEELARMERRALRGDGDIAHQLYFYYLLERHESDTASAWLRRAAVRGIAKAQWELANDIKSGTASWSGFGATKQEAFRALMESASRTRAYACYDLALAYEDGYFGHSDYSAAMKYFRLGGRMGYRSCWQKLYEYCRYGIGASTNVVESYYWIALVARYQHPESILGSQSWSYCDELASQLTLRELEQAWRLVDRDSAAMARRVMDFPPNLGAGWEPGTEDCQSACHERERLHRRQWRSMKS